MLLLFRSSSPETPTTLRTHPKADCYGTVLTLCAQFASTLQIFIFLIYLINLFIFGCVGSLLLRVGFL